MQIASRHRPQEAIIADNLSLPHPRSSFDFAISIAVVHHLSTNARRIGAIAAILETLHLVPNHPNKSLSNDRPLASALIYVWALEQKNSRRGWDEGDEQDVMVPWVLKQNGNADGKEGSTTFNRYYHLYRRGELEDDILQAGGKVESSGYEKDNWWVIATRRPAPDPGLELESVRQGKEGRVCYRKCEDNVGQ